MKRVFSVKNIIIIGFIIIFLIVFWGGRDINYVFGNIDDFEVITIPYNGEIEFVLQTNDILTELEEPEKLETIYNTDVYLWEITEAENYSGRAVHRHLER